MRLCHAPGGAYVSLNLRARSGFRCSIPSGEGISPARVSQVESLVQRAVIGETITLAGVRPPWYACWEFEHGPASPGFRIKSGTTEVFDKAMFKGRS